jgi:hypothetical protein
VQRSPWSDLPQEILTPPRLCRGEPWGWVSPPCATTMNPHLTLLPGSTDRSVRPRKSSLGAASRPVLLSSGVIHTVPMMNRSTELMGADTRLRQERKESWVFG